MTSRLAIFPLLILALAINASCQNTGKPSAKGNDSIQGGADVFFKQIQQLDEFKSEEKRADSINKKTQTQIKVSVDIMGTSFFKEDSGKNVSLAFINENWPYEQRTIYTVKFDKQKQKIISVDKNKKGKGQPDLPMTPEDIPLPPIKNQ
jgi:hypothetical protein